MQVWTGSWVSESGRYWRGVWSPGVKASGASGAPGPRSQAGAREAVLRLELRQLRQHPDVGQESRTPGRPVLPTGTASHAR